MSQVRKLQEGGKTSKYKILFDDQEYYITEDQLRDINDQVDNMEPALRAQVGNLSSVIQSGRYTGNLKENVQSLDVYTGVSNKDLDKLKNRKSSKWDAATNNKVYRSQQATNQVLHIIRNVLRKGPATTGQSSSKKAVEKSTIQLDYNNGVLSPTKEDNFNAQKRVSDLITHLKAGDASEYDYSAYNTDAISAWLDKIAETEEYKDTDKYASGNKYFSNLWAAMGKPGYKYDADVEDLLEMFGIKYNIASPTSGGTGGGTGSTGGTTGGTTGGGATDGNTDASATIQAPVVDTPTAPSVRSANPNNPTLITPDMVAKMGLDPKYTFGLIDVNGDKYTPEEVKTNRNLYSIMDYVESINKQNMPQSERYAKISERLNIPGIENYSDWIPGTKIKGVDLDNIFRDNGILSAGISEQQFENPNGYRVFKYFNNGEASNNPWGFRSPYYLVVDKDGNLQLNGNESAFKGAFNNISTVGQSAPSMIEGTWNPEDVFVDKWTGATSWSDNWGGVSVPSTQRKLRLSEIGKVVLPFNNVTQRIMRDINDTWYAVGSDGKTRKINKDYAKKILQGLGITRAEWHQNISDSYKEGGTISKSKVDSFKQKFIPKSQRGGTVRWDYGNGQYEDVTYDELPPDELLEAFLSEEREKRGTWAKSGLEGNTTIRQYPKMTVVRNPAPYNYVEQTQETEKESPEKTTVKYIQDSGKTIHLLPDTDKDLGQATTLRYNVGDYGTPLSVPTVSVPLAKQNVVKVKTNNNQSFDDLVNVLRQLVDKKQVGGVLKGQRGLNLKYGVPDYALPSNLSTDEINNIAYRPGIDWGTYINGIYTPYGNDPGAEPKENYLSGVQDIFNEAWNLNAKSSAPDLSAYGPKDVEEIPVEEDSLPRPKLQAVDPTKTVGMKLDDKFNPSAITYHSGILPRSTSTATDTEVDDGGGIPEDLSDSTKNLIPAISLVRYLINSGLQRKYRDTSKKAIEAARFNELPVQLNTPRNDNPALDRALQQVRSERMAGIKPVTSDVIANNAMANQREAQLYDREQNITTQRSQADWEAKKEALNIMNQNIANQISTANQNRARNASINSALYNPELEYLQRKGQSIENLGLEIQNNIKQDRNVILNYEKQKEIERQSDILNRKLDTLFPGARAEYNGLGVDEKAKYVDFEDYIRRKYPETWSANIETIENWQKSSASAIRDWLYQNGLNYRYPRAMTGTSSGVYKKGGYLRGSTRYTKEPEEQIWIDNNKATHHAIAKLSDNTIKLLLRALK